MKNEAKFGSAADSFREYVGEDVAAVVRELKRKKDYSEFKLAEAIRKEVNETRNLLYKLYSANLASFVKKKNHKIGWYIHYWTFHEDRVISFLLNKKKDRLAVLKELVSNENKNGFYSCSNNCVSIDFDLAVDLSFRCHECGGLLSQRREKKVKDWDAETAALEMDIKALAARKAFESEERFGKNKKLEESEEEAKKRKRRG